MGANVTTFPAKAYWFTVRRRGLSSCYFTHIISPCQLTRFVVMSMRCRLCIQCTGVGIRESKEEIRRKNEENGNTDAANDWATWVTGSFYFSCSLAVPFESAAIKTAAHGQWCSADSTWPINPVKNFGLWSEQDYKSLCVVIVICVTLINTWTDSFWPVVCC